MTSPNLFDVATSELSQDAFITWLLLWGDPKHKQTNEHLHQCATNFIQRLLATTEEISSVEAGRQWNHIDVWAKVNDKYFLIIEDKKGTKEHSDQLARYKTGIEKEFAEKAYRIVTVYYKMDEQSNFGAVKQAGYSVFSRKQMLSVLDAHSGAHDVLSEYYWHLKRLDTAIEAYRTLPRAEWNWFAWRGFFSQLQEKLGDGEWDYVPNASGGFLGFWWHWQAGNIADVNFKLYLQLEYDKLIVKVESFDKGARNQIRSALRWLLYPLAQEHGISMRNYGRVGTYMGISRLCDDYRIEDGDRTVDMDLTVTNLRRMEALLDGVHKKMKENS